MQELVLFQFIKKHWKGIVAAVMVIVILIAAVLTSVANMWLALWKNHEKYKSKSTSSSSVTKLYVRATKNDNSAIEGLKVVLAPEEEGISFNFPETDADGLASVVLTSGAAGFDGVAAGGSMEGSVSFYCNHGKGKTGVQTQPGTCAVDAYIIPLGSVLYIQSCKDDGTPDGEDYGYAVATDTGSFTGGMYKNDKGEWKYKEKGTYDTPTDIFNGEQLPRLVDVWYSSESEGNASWGLRRCNIYIIERGELEGYSAAACNQATDEKVKEYQSKNAPADLRDAEQVATASTSGLADTYTISYSGAYVSGEDASLDMEACKTKHQTVKTTADDATDVTLEFWIATETSGRSVQGGTTSAVCVTTDGKPIDNTSASDLSSATNLKPCYKVKGSGAINPCYYSSQPQCVAYAWGRIYELFDGYKSPLYGAGSAKKLWDKNYGDKIIKISATETPQTGDAMILDGPKDAGHIAVVEAVEGDTIYISDSGQSWKSKFYDGYSHTDTLKVGATKLYGANIRGYLRPNR